MQGIRRVVLTVMAAALILGAFAGGAAAVCVMSGADAAAPCECPGCPDCDASDDSRKPCFNIACGAAFAAAPYATVDALALPERTIAAMQPRAPAGRGVTSQTEPPDPPPPR